MFRACALAMLAGLTAVTAASAQTATWYFRWQPRQVLNYRVDHVTSVTEMVGGSRIEAASELAVIKRWQVLAVDAQGTATLQLSLTAMRNKQTRADGEVLLFDSANLDKSNPEMREQLTKFIN